MAEAFLETTVWEDGNKNINHTYYLEGDKMLAYVRYGTTEPKWFTNPITISRKGRKFQRVDAGPFEAEMFMPVTDSTVKPELVEVKGSKGNVYYVNVAEGTCTCPGFTFRGHCKHIEKGL